MNKISKNRKNLGGKNKPFIKRKKFLSKIEINY